MRRAARRSIQTTARLWRRLQSFPGRDRLQSLAGVWATAFLIFSSAWRVKIIWSKSKTGRSAQSRQKFDARSRALFSEVEGETSGGPYFRWRGGLTGRGKSHGPTPWKHISRRGVVELPEGL